MCLLYPASGNASQPSEITAIISDKSPSIMRKVSPLSLWASIVLLLPAPARDTAIPTEGLHQNTPRILALTNAKLILSPTEVLESGAIAIRDGLIESVGSDTEIPADARIRCL